MSPDPTGIFLGNTNDPQQLDLYTYARNNPLTLTDPSGLGCRGFDGEDFGCGSGDDGGDDFGFGFDFGFGWGGGGGNWDWGGGPQGPSYSPPGVGTSPNPSNGTLTSDDPFSGETNGIPNGLGIPVGLAGILMPGGGGCNLGACTGGANGFAGAIAIGGFCAAQPEICGAITVTVYGLYLAHHFGIDAAAVHAIRPIFESRKADLRQFDEVVRQIEQRCGKSLDRGQRRRLHDEISKQGYSPDEMVEIGVGMFCPGK